MNPLEFQIDGEIVREEAPGLNRLLGRGPLPLPQALEIGRQIARTLSALHRRDLIHRDLRPAHVLWDEASGRVRLVGLERAVRVSSETWKVSAPEKLEGDPTYLAPEATGRLARRLDYRADLYSLGVIFFEMLTGRPPFVESDPMARVHAHLARESPDPRELRPELPPVVSAITAKLLAKTAEARYRSGLGLARDLGRCLDELETTGEVSSFALGEGDVAERFELAEGLVGRSDELAWLEAALEVDGAPKVRLVAGYSGVGKTALVDALRASARRRRGLFVSGRCEPAQAVPYGAIIEGLRALIRQRLGAGADRLRVWSDALTEELGPLLGVLAEALPELAEIFDTIPPASPTEPANVRSRFHSCIARFLSTFTSDDDEQGPPVLFLDDLQWIDPASAELLPSLGGAGPFLLLGAFRDHEVDEHHPLSHALEELRTRGVDVETLSLAPLAEADLAELISLALLTPASSLVELVYRKTAGNPFFARTFLRTLHQRGLLRFEASSPETPQWTWDLEEIAALEATENVVELVAARLTELPPAVRRTLALAAIFGKEIAPDTLAALRSGGDAEVSTEEILALACEEGCLVEVDQSQEASTSRYAFVHDRIREGAAALLSEEERASAHLKIFRLLRDRAAGRAERTPDLFAIVEHAKRSARLITDPQELRDLISLNQEAARRAKAAGAFPAAFNALDHALELLKAEGGDPWNERYELTYSLHLDAAQTACLAKDFDAAEQLAQTVLENARSLLEKTPAEETRIYRLFAQRKVDASLRLSLDVLGRFGVEMPLHPTAADLWPAVLAADRAVTAVESKGIDELPTMRAPEQLAVARLLLRTAINASWARHALTRMATCRLVVLTAEQGVHPLSPVAYSLMSDVRHGELEDVDGARRVGELALALTEHPAAGPDDTACRFASDVVVGGLTLHPTALLERMRENYRRFMAAGDPLLASGAAFQVVYYDLFAGAGLPRVKSGARELRAQVLAAGQQMIGHVMEGIKRLIDVLLSDGEIDAVVALIEEAEPSVRVRLIGPEMLVRAVLRDPDASAVAHESLKMPKGLLPGMPLDFLRCLIFLETAIREGEAEPPEVAACFTRLETRARETPEIYAHKRDLILALRHRAAGRITEALAVCEEAIDAARQSDLPHEHAMACESAAELCLESAVGREDSAATHLDEALSLYRRWGARAKLDELNERFQDLLAASSAPCAPLDVLSFAQAGEMLASELDLARLLRRLAALLLQNAGAQRAFLIHASPEGPALEVRAESATPAPHVELLEKLPIEQCEDLAVTLVRFVARTRETVIFDAASRDPRFDDDPYVKRATPRSILCLPLLHRGEALEIVYLENAASPDVFSPERSAAVRLLASQAAAALENARLHDSLKREVETRRRAELDLRRALEEVAALKDRLEHENVYLQEEIGSHFEEIVGASEAIGKVLYKVEQVAATDATVLVLGETGTGKELFARALHRLSRRRERPLVKVNCAALPATLIESELFGHEKGAFTGALARKTGRFELADSGTLFLDEIGELPLDLQAKLLRVLQEGEIERLGGTKTIRVDVRVVAATNRDLEKAMAEGSFRPDLYYRLTVFPIELPPLRERDGDIPRLVRFFIDRKRGELASRVEKIPQGVMERLVAYSWPGNVRELENVVERALILSPGENLLLEESFGGSMTPVEGTPAEGTQSLVEVERAHIVNVLKACGWKIKGRGNAAERLGLAPPTLRDRMKKFGIVRPKS